MEDSNWELTFKIIIIGDSGVGKSCVLCRFVDHSFSDSYVHTIGVDFKIRTMSIDNKTVKIQAWDTAGQDRFISITTSYYRGADGIFIVYDVTDKHSFENVLKWMNEVRKHAKENANVMLIGNKSDLKHKRVVEYTQGQELANELGVDFLETSAKNADNIEDAFKHITKEMMKSLAPASMAKPQQQHTHDSGSNRKLNTVKVENESKCACII